MRRTHFRGGVHPPDKKEATSALPVEAAPVPERVVLPVSQHIGRPAIPLVGVGDTVKKGQKIAEADGDISVPLHASTSGKVVALGGFPSPMGFDAPSIVIESDGEDAWAEGSAGREDYLSLSPDELRAAIKEAGVVGMGGACFPTHVKLAPPEHKTIRCAILNGAECEPYLTADSRLMEESPEDVIGGLKVMMAVLRVTDGYVGIEANKPAAIERMRQEAGKLACELVNEKYYDRSGLEIDVPKGCMMNVRVEPLEVKYPQGSEKQLIKAMLGREVPPGGLPMDVGAVVQNVATAAAIYQAVRFGRPLIERIITVTGPGIKNPKNLRVRIGTLFSDIIGLCGGLTDDAAKVIMGGPMMGVAVSELMVPVIKGTNGIVALTGKDAAVMDIGPCIRCGRCIDVCPMGLNPGLIAQLVEKGQFEEAGRHGLLDCFECGSCSFVCPSSRPLVQLNKWAKRELAKKKVKA